MVGHPSDKSFNFTTDRQHFAGKVNWAKQEQRYVFSGFPVGCLICLTFAGSLVNKFGAKWSFAFAFVLIIVSTVFIPVLSHLSFIYVTFLRILTGMGSAFAFPVIYESSSHWCAKYELGTFLALSLGGLQFGMMVSMIMDGLECSALDWPYVFYIASAAGGVFLVVWVVFYNNDPTESRWVKEDEKFFILSKRTRTNPKKRKVPYKAILSSPAVWALCVSSASAGSVGYLLNYLPTYFKEVLKLNVENNGVFSALPNLAFLIGRCLAGPLSDKKFGFKTHQPVMKIFNTAAFLVAAVGLFILTFVTESTSPATPLVLLLVVYFGLSFVTGGFYKSPVYMAPEFSGVIGSLHMACNFGIAACVPYVVSAMTKHGSANEWHHVFYFCTTTCILGAVVFLVFGKGELQSWAKGVSSKEGFAKNLSAITLAESEQEF